MPALNLLFSVVRRVHICSLLAVIAIAMGSAAAVHAKVVKQVLKLSGSNISVPALGWSDADARPQAVLIAIHGGVQHAGSYTALAEQLAPKGILVYSIDLRGHGQWLVQNKHRPKLNYNASSDDVVALASQLRVEHPGLPVFCIGESIGAAVALHAVATEPKLFDGLILASAGTRPHLGHAWPSIFGSVVQGVDSLCCSIALSPYLKGISEDPRSCNEMIDDPSNRNKASLGDLLHMANFVRRNRTFAAKVENSVPILMMQGTEDQICSPKSAELVFEQLTVKDKSLKIFQGCGHLLTTTVYLKPEVVTTVADWLQVHAKAAQLVTIPVNPHSSTQAHASKAAPLIPGSTPAAELSGG